MRKQIFSLFALFSLFVPQAVLAAEPGAAVTDPTVPTPTTLSTPLESVEQAPLTTLTEEKKQESVTTTKAPNPPKIRVEKEEKVKICHVTGSERNRYVYLEVAKSAADGYGKNDHTKHMRDGFKDIIPIGDVNKDGKIGQADCDAMGGGEDCKLMAPALISPANYASNVDLHTYLKWQAVPGATRYVLQITVDPAFKTYDTYVVEGNQKLFDLSYGTTYYWRVQAVKEQGEIDCVSAFSPIWSFTTKCKADCKPCKLSGPMLVSPANGATNLDPTLTLDWEAVAGADRYQVQVATSVNFTNIVVNRYVTATELALTLNDNTHYYWRVRAIDKDYEGCPDKVKNGCKLKKQDCYSPWSERHFTTKDLSDGQGGGVDIDLPPTEVFVTSPLVLNTTPNVEAAELEGFGAGGTLPEAGSYDWLIAAGGAALLTFILRQRELRFKK